MAAPGQNPFEPRHAAPIAPGVAPPFTSNAMPAVAPAPAAVVPPSNGKPEMTLPPSLWGSTKREPLRESLRNAKWMLIAYLVLLLNGHLALLAVLAAYENPFKTIEIGLEFTLPSVVGAIVGCGIAMMRVRSWIVWVAVIALSIVFPFTLAPLPPLLIAAYAFVWSLGSGHLAVQRKSSLSAIFMPVVCWSGAILILLEHERRLETWTHGDKGAIWQPIPLVLLFLAITEIFFFFAGQEHFQTSVWQTHAGHETALKRLAGGGARMTGKGIFAITVFSGIICAAVALLSPYLWRTEERQGNGSGGDNGSQQQGGNSGQGGGQNGNDPNGNGNGQNGSGNNNNGQQNGSGNNNNGQQNGRGGGNGNDTAQNDPNGSGQSGRPEFDPDAVGRALERAKDEAEKSASWLLPLIPLFLLTRPLRRAFLLRHLRKPFWRVNPSRRARNLWRYVLIALGDAGIKRSVSDSIDDEVRRIDTKRAEHGMQPAKGLADAAKQYQRMRFGLGIPAGALDELRGHVESAFHNVRAPLDEWQRFKSWWRKIEV